MSDLVNFAVMASLLNHEITMFDDGI